MLESLEAPIPRNIYDSVIMYSDLELLLKMLKERKLAREAVVVGKVPTFEWHSSIKNVIIIFLTSDICWGSFSDG